MAKKAIIGEKVGMTQVWDADNRAVPVTVLRVVPVRVVQVKTPENEGYGALQVTYGVAKVRKDAKARSGGSQGSVYARGALNRPAAGHFDKWGVEPGRRLVELRLDDVSAYAVGDEIAADIFTSGDKVDVTAVARGKGFAGGMKRHNFKGQGAAHGNHKKHRSPGSVGACATPARVFKGTRMAGRLGGGSVTTLNVEVVQADPDRQIVLVRGSVPGPRGAMVVIRNAVKIPSPDAGVAS
ncbi:MAG: 50S ribosomal protein L3 [Actinomycetota bacterium]|nr:50S ribosomal protein L3 [Actinomycetota bacterium]